jgi:hypothetical protein
MTAFWDIAPCSLVEVDRHFTVNQPDDESITPLKRRSTSTRRRRCIPESCPFHTRRRENLKSHMKIDHSTVRFVDTCINGLCSLFCV